MFDAQTLISKGTAYKILSPWMARGGDYLLASFDVVAVDGCSVTVTLFSKNSEVSGDGTSASTTTVTLSAVGVTSQQWRSGGAGGTSNATLDELVRFEFHVTTTTAGKWISFRMLAPVWYDAVDGD